jgi:hypothetical protein
MINKSWKVLGLQALFILRRDPGEPEAPDYLLELVG